MSQPMYRNALVFVPGSWIILATIGCGTTSFDRAIVLGELDAQRLVERMAAGETTRADEQAFIIQTHAAWRQLRTDRDLMNPTEAGPHALDFQKLQIGAPNAAFRDLAWAWLQLAVTHPGLDLRRSAVETPAAADAP